MLEGNEHTIPNNMEEFVRANNAHLQVILKNQATILTHLFNLNDLVQVLYVRDKYPGLPETQEAECKVRNNITETMINTTLSMIKLDVQQIYLQLSLEKFK